MLRRALARPNAPIVLGAVLGIATVAAYVVGAGRSFGYDAAATFANFVATPNLTDAFALHSVVPTIEIRAVASNDHVFLSLISHVIYSVTGSRSEFVYRIVPAVAAGGTVGVSAAVLAKRFGLLAGACAGVFIATNPLFVENSRDLRGYSLAALLALVATVLLANSLSPQGRGFGRGARLAYGLLLGLAIATHVFLIVVLAGHIVWIATRRSWPELRKATPAWIAALVIGAAANANIEMLEFVQHGFPASMFLPTFPRDLILFLVGAPVLLTVGLWLSTAGLGLWAVRRETWVWASIVVFALVVAILWLVLKPAYLFPRFFIFLIPGVAYLVAAAVQRWKVLAPIVLAGAVAAVAAEVPLYTEDPLALPQAAQAAQNTKAAGGTACVIHSDEQILAAYTNDFRVITNADELGGCTTVVVVSWGIDLALRDVAAQEFPHRTVLPAYYPTVVLGR